MRKNTRKIVYLRLNIELFKILYQTPLNEKKIR